MKREHHGQCHCGAVAFEVSLDLEDGTNRCNCSICRRARFWRAHAPESDFTLVRGEDALTEFLAGNGIIRHRFCRVCGIKTHARVDMGAACSTRSTSPRWTCPMRISSVCR